MFPEALIRLRALSWLALPCVAFSPLSAASLGGTFTPIAGTDPAFNLTALGTSDWAYWSSTANPASGTPANEKAAASLVGSLSPVGGGNVRGSTSTTRPITDITYSDGTSPATGTENNVIGLFNSNLNTNGAGVSLQITLPTTEDYQVTVFVAKFAVPATFTATLPGATSYVDSSLTAADPLGGKSSAYYTLFVTPDQPGDVLTVSLVAAGAAANSHVVINAAAVSVNDIPDPLLVQDTVAGAANLAFGTVFSATGESATRTLRFRNDGATQDLDIDSVAFTGTDAGDFAITDLALNGTGGQSTPLTLAPGDFLDVSVKAAPAVTGKTARTANLVVGTGVPEQDKTVPASATVLGFGDVINDNTSFSATGPGGTANLWSALHYQVSPGLLPGSDAMVRVPGVGDFSGNDIGQANQASGIPNGASDFEAVFHFTPVAASEYSFYTGFDADGGLTDRSMQYLILADDLDVRDGMAMTDLQTGNIIVNLAYMPAGVIAAGTPGFYVFNGSTWDLAIAADLAGSVDLNNDGVLDPGTGDTIHRYRVSIKAAGWGQVGASYVIRVSSPTDPGIVGTLSSGPLSIWHGANGESSTLAAHSFTTGDLSDSNPMGGLATPFWVDDAYLHVIEQPDPWIMATAPSAIDFDGDLADNGTAPLVIRNEGHAQDLEITAFHFDDPSFSLESPPTLPLVLAPGASAELEVRWDATLAAPDNAARGLLSVDSNALASPTAIAVTASTHRASNLLRNWNLEVPGANTTTDKFAFWEESVPAGTIVFDGLVAGSTRAARFTGTRFGNSLGSAASGFQIDFPIVFFETPPGADRRLHFHLVTESLGGNEDVNLRITPDWIFQCFDGGAWVNVPNLDFSAAPLQHSLDADANESLNDPGDTRHVYWLRVRGAGWGTPAANLAFQLLDSDATTSLGDSGDRTDLFREPAEVQAFPLRTIRFLSDLGSPRYAIDDVLASLVAAGPGVVVTGVSGGPGGFTIHYDAGGAAVNVARSVGGLQGFTDIATGETSGTYVDTSAPAGAAYYRVYIP